MTHGADPEPSATDLVERALLGSLLIVGNTALATVARTLKADAFARDAHRVIYEAIAGVARDGGDPDLVLVINELDATGRLAAAGGAVYVASLVDGLPDVGNVLFYARHVRERALLRKATTRRRTP